MARALDASSATLAGTGPCPLRAASLSSLLDAFRELKDSRRGHGLYFSQSYVLACAAVAVLMGAGGYQAVEDTCSRFSQRQLRALGCRRDEDKKYRAPSDSTFYRVLSKINTAHFDRIISHWLLDQEVSEIARLAIDGKTLRQSGRKGGKPLQLLSVVTHRLCWTLGQIPIEEKSNEIPAFPKLVRELPDAEKVLITADAMHCQQESARVVTQERGWDYLFGLKGNQSGILEKAQTLLDEQGFPPDDQVDWETDHGRLERRRIARVAVTPEQIGLCGCWQVIAVRRERIMLVGEQQDIASEEIAYYATSLCLDESTGEEMLRAIRGHWSAIENGVHYRRDVSFGEDQCRISDRGAAQAMASLRNLAIGLYELFHMKKNIRATGCKSWCRRMSFHRALALLQARPA